jgi:hypothetical protein
MVITDKKKSVSIRAAVKAMRSSQSIGEADSGTSTGRTFIPQCFFISVVMRCVASSEERIFTATDASVPRNLKRTRKRGSRDHKLRAGGTHGQILEAVKLGELEAQAGHRLFR